jgi:hypothetical protein
MRIEGDLMRQAALRVVNCRELMRIDSGMMRIGGIMMRIAGRRHVRTLDRMRIAAFSHHLGAISHHRTRVRRRLEEARRRAVRLGQASAWISDKASWMAAAPFTSRGLRRGISS